MLEQGRRRRSRRRFVDALVHDLLPRCVIRLVYTHWMSCDIRSTVSASIELFAASPSRRWKSVFKWGNEADITGLGRVGTELHQALQVEELLGRAPQRSEASHHALQRLTEFEQIVGPFRGDGRNTRPSTRFQLDEPLRLQRLESLAHGVPRHVQLVRKLVFEDSLALLQSAVDDASLDLVEHGATQGLMGCAHSHGQRRRWVRLASRECSDRHPCSASAFPDVCFRIVNVECGH